MLLTEFRHAARHLVRRPGFLLLGTAALGLGLAAAVLVFMAVNTLMLRPVPGIHSAQPLVEVGRLSRDGGFDTFSYPDFFDLRERVRTLDKVYAWRMGPAYATVTGDPVRTIALLVSGDYFEALGPGAAHGALISPVHDTAPGGNPVVVASHGAFVRLFDGDPAAIGSKVALNGSVYTLIGVTAPEFRGHIAAIAPDFYVPLSMAEAMSIGRIGDRESRQARSLHLGARVAADTTLDQVNEELRALGTVLSETFPISNREVSFAAAPLRPLPQGAQRLLGILAGALFVLCGAILALACTNLAGVLLAQGEARGGELGMRSVLGAGRGRVALQLFFEALLVALCAGLLALALVLAGRGLLNVLPLPTPFPIDLTLAFDYRVVLFCLGTTLVLAMGFGLLPALRVSAAAPGREAALVGGRVQRQHVRHGLLAFQAALTVALLLMAALVLRALDAADAIETGFRVEEVYTADVDLTPTNMDSAAGTRVLEQLGDRLEQYPGIERASFASVVPLTMSRLGYGSGRAPGETDGFGVDVNTVGEGFFDVFALPVKGRPIDLRDAAGGDRAAVINQTFARRLYGEQDAVGREFELGYGEQWDRVRIVGVVPDGRYASLADQGRAFAFLAAPQWPRTEFAMMVHARGGAGVVRQALEQEMRTLLPGVPPPPVHSFESSAALSILPQKILASAATALGLLALLLAATGLYGVLAFQVERRVREFGLRKALGSSGTAIAASLLRRTAVWLLIGAGAGLALGQLASLALGEMLFGIGGGDALALTAVLLVFALMALLAIALPLVRALHLQPMEALRHD
ncbi:MAG TPA: ABC transporter permease [Xanthomonadaceae bacterium]|nr:ABC transporter permease [Xanthomonadaceae bacterium]